MSIERYTETTAILPGEWVIPVDSEQSRKALPPRQVKLVEPYGILFIGEKTFAHKDNIVFVCDTETEAYEVYSAIVKYRDQREKEIAEIRTRVDLNMQHELDIIIANANAKG